MFNEYKRFILRGNVVDLAVGVVAGTAFGLVINSAVRDIMTPVIAAVFQQPDFSSLVWTLGEGEIRIGDFLNAVLAFILTMTGMFFLIVKPVNVATQRFIPPEEPHGPELRECPECLSDIPALARRCAHCASELAPTAM